LDLQISPRNAWERENNHLNENSNPAMKQEHLLLVDDDPEFGATASVRGSRTMKLSAV
jgi:hypothetical protein